MTWPFENDTSTIVKKLVKRSLASEKRRNLMVVVAVAVHIGGIVPLSGMLLTQQIVSAHPCKFRQFFQSRNLGFIHAIQNRFIGISHLITLDLYNGDGYYR